jgi:TPP-dependent 2-oxoacid decarboxylase
MLQGHHAREDHMGKTVIQHVLSRLRDIGIKDIFGVAGDFVFPVHDAICSDKNFRFVGDCNELNASYAADGYARIHGLAALSTTYGGALGQRRSNPYFWDILHGITKYPSTR